MTKADASVLVIHRDAKQLTMLARVARAVAGTVQVGAALTDDDDLDGFDLVVAEYEGLTERDCERLFPAALRDGEAAAAEGNATRDGSDDSDDSDTDRFAVILTAATDDYKRLFLDLERHRFTSVLASRPTVSPTELIVTMQKLLRADVFGLNKYFSWGVDIASLPLRNSTDTARAIELATGLATLLEVHPRLIANLATAVEELTTNGLYNAPVDARGTPRFSHLPRTTPVALDPGEEVVLSVCSDGWRIGVCVADSFGAITREHSLGLLLESLRRGTTRPRANKGGAGIGLYMTFESLNHLIINVRPGVRTEVIGLIDIRGSYRDFVNRGKSLNIFVDRRRDSRFDP